MKYFLTRTIFFRTAILIYASLILASKSQGSGLCLGFYTSGDIAQIVSLQSEIQNLLKQWNRVPVEKRKAERRVSVKISEKVDELLNLRDIKAKKDSAIKRAHVILPIQDGSPWNRFAFDVYRTMNRLKVVYDPLELKKSNAGALYVDTTNTLYISNEVILKHPSSKIWHTSFELHETVHAYVTELQRRNLWHPLWAELSTDGKHGKFMDTYDTYIALDEIMAYYKQIFTELAKVNASSETQEMLEFLIPIAKKMTEVVFKNIQKFIVAEPESTEVLYRDGATRVILRSNGLELSLLVSFKKDIKKEDALQLAKEQIQEIADRVDTLRNLYLTVGRELPLKNHSLIRELMSSKRDLISFIVIPR